MRVKKFLFPILFILFIVMISSGCVTKTPSSVTIASSPTQIPEAVALRDSGFKAYLNGENATALEFYNQSLVADPDYTRAWIDKGDVLIQLNRTTEAILAYDSALALDNDLAIVWNSRGEALMAMKNYTAALESFNNALRIAPKYSAAKENRDLVLKKMS